MIKTVRYTLAAAFLMLCGTLSAQTDTIQKHISERLKKIESELKSNPRLQKDYEDLTFYYSQVFKNLADTQKGEGFKTSGYIDAYYAYYSDKLPTGAYQKFPTTAPISNNFGLNMAMISLSYQSTKVRGIMTLHAGDIPSCAWSEKFNVIQDANIGMRLVKNLWLDAGFFRTHIGIESIQPRENIGSSLAIPTYYEPYYLSGAKLTYYPSQKLSFQVNVFNGFNTFVPINNKKAYGFSIVYQRNSQFTATFNALVSDNSPDSQKYNQTRFYQNIYMIYKSKHWDVGFEFNFGSQMHTGITDSTRTAFMYSSLLAAKYKFKRGKFGVYGRCEGFSDKDEILTGPVVNQYHTLVGVNALSATLGGEYKPVNNSFLRLESRFIHLWDNESIFYTDHKYTNIRLEFIATLGVWF